MIFIFLIRNFYVTFSTLQLKILQLEYKSFRFSQANGFINSHKGTLLYPLDFVATWALDLEQGNGL